MELSSNVTATKILPSWIIPIDILNIGFDTFTLTATLLFLYIIVFENLCNTVPMVLIANSCVAQFLFVAYLFFKDILALYYDIYEIQCWSWFYMFITYIGCISVAMQYYSYVLQAMNQYILVVYPTRLFYQSMKFQIFMAMIMWACCIMYPIPSLLTNQIKFHPDDGIYQIPLRLSFTTIFNACFIYFIPMPSIIIIYLKMVKYVHEMSKRTSLENSLFHAKRQLMVVRRIVALVSILLILGIPYGIFIFMSFFNRAPKYHFRIAFTFASASMVLVMIILFQITNPLNISIKRKLGICYTTAREPI